MERRTWPWKKKSSDKGTVDKTVAMPEVVAASLSSVASLGDQVCSLIHIIHARSKNYSCPSHSTLNCSVFCSSILIRKRANQ